MYLTVTVMADKGAFLHFLLDFAPGPCTRYLKRFILTIDMVKSKISHAAIKVLHTQLTGKQLEEFRQEGRLLARLSHPHIIRVLDFDVEDTMPFLVMNYAPGGDLPQNIHLLTPIGSRR
jgi:hypothetical protein